MGGLGTFAAFAGGFFGFQRSLTFPAHFLFDEFEQSDIGGSEGSGFGEERAASGRAAGIELADPAGDEVDEDIGVAHFGEGLFAEVGVQGNRLRVRDERGDENRRLGA